MGYLYQRSPRILPDSAKGERKVPAPPPSPYLKPAGKLRYLIPVAVIPVGAGGLFYMETSRKAAVWPGSLLFVLIPLLMLLSLVLPLFIRIYEKKRLEAMQASRRAVYLQQLQELEHELTAERVKQKEKMLLVHSDFERCDSAVRRRSPSLWERSMGDPDFLSLRVGTGVAAADIIPYLVESEFSSQDELLEPARKLVKEALSIDETPVVLPLLDTPVIGIVARKEEAAGVLRSLMVQLTTRHSPDEVLLSAFFKEELQDDWLWMRWFPHMWDEQKTFRRMACTEQEQRQLAELLKDALLQRIASSSRERQAGGAPIVERHVILLAEPALLENDPLYSLLSEQGEGAGAHTIIVARSVDELPRQCRLIVECEDGRGTYTHKKKDGSTETGSFQLDRIPSGQSEEFARYMARIELKRSRTLSLPHTVPLLESLDISDPEVWSAADRWQKNRLPLAFPVNIGRAAGDKPFVLNLHDRPGLGGHGPHGLIAGTTGSGKSELLQAIIASIAANCHPHDAAFLLIDYKGGGMSGIFRELPHVTGFLTNLERNLVERAKTALRAELIARQNRLKQAGGLTHIDEYYKLGAPDGPMPHLFVIVDEFAELKKDYPDFIEELVSVASIGRTLGLHLILATQKPAGVVDEKIWSNARFRICLRVESEADSREMLKIPDAAWIKTSGRGYVQTGPEKPEEVQFAWPGTPFIPASHNQVKELKVLRVALNGARKEFSPGLKVVQGSRAGKLAAKELEILTARLSHEAAEQGIARLSGPWLDPLPERLDLPELRLHSDEREPADLTAYIGLMDDVQGQRQYGAAVRLYEGHFALYGMPGSGKTTFLQTLLLSLALNAKPDWQAYIIDMGRMLQDFHALPQVGAVIAGDEQDRIGRLFRYLRKTAAQRREKLAAAGIKKAENFRDGFGRGLADIVVLLDDYHLFRSSYPFEAELLDELLRLGGAAGIRFVVTAGRFGDIPEKTRSLIGQTAALELADPADYYYAVGRVNPYGPRPGGRGYMKGAPPLEFQTALPVRGNGEYERAEHLREAITRAAAGFSGTRPPRIPETPAKATLREMLPVGRYSGQEAASLPVPVGIEVLDLVPVRVRLDSGPHFVVGAPAGGGKTSLLMSWVLSLAWHNHPSKLQVYLLEARPPLPGSAGLQQLSALPHVRACKTGEEGAREIVQLLQEDVRQAGTNAGRTARVLVIDDADLLSRRLDDFTVKDKLTEIVRGGRETGVHVLLSGNPAGFPNFGADWITEVKACQTGFVLGTKDPADLAFFRIPLRESASDPGELPVLPPGEGFYVNRKYERIKAAVPFDRLWTPETWIAKVCDQWEISV